MIVDISHVSADTMRDVLALSKAPVIFSHSSARSVNNVSRNVPDDVLEQVVRTSSSCLLHFPGFLARSFTDHQQRRSDGEFLRLFRHSGLQQKQSHSAGCSWQVPRKQLQIVQIMTFYQFQPT